MTVLSDRYELQELLGSGGMAEVHAAVDRKIGRRVAVKLVHQNLLNDGQSRQRLLREAQSAASFHHPNSVAVYDVGEDDRRPFIVMELVDGESLQDRLERDGRLEPSEAVRISAGVLAALEAAHEQGLVHRDIKPGNVLLPQRGGVKLADFGIAKAVADTASNLTSAGAVMGTPKYLSPEQVAGHSAVPASDLYSLGVVLYECLAGKPPFAADSAVALALAHQRDKVPPLRRAARDVPSELASVVEQALAKDPGERFADAAAMRQALEASVGAAPAHTAPAHATDPAPDNAPYWSYARTTVLPSDREPPDAEDDAPSASPPPPARSPRRHRGRKGLGILAVILILAVAGLLAVMFLPDLVFDDDTDDEPVDEAPEVDEQPDEPQPEPQDEPDTAPDQQAPPDPPADDPPADDPPADDPPADDPPPGEDGD